MTQVKISSVIFMYKYHQSFYVPTIRKIIKYWIEKAEFDNKPMLSAKILAATQSKSGIENHLKNFRLRSYLRALNKMFSLLSTNAVLIRKCLTCYSNNFVKSIHLLDFGIQVVLNKQIVRSTN